MDTRAPFSYWDISLYFPNYTNLSAVSEFSTMAFQRCNKLQLQGSTRYHYFKVIYIYVLQLKCFIVFIACQYLHTKCQDTGIQDIQRTTAHSAGRDQKMRTLTERHHLKWWSAKEYIAPRHLISGHNVISLHFLIWLIFPSDLDKAYHGKFQSFRECKKLVDHDHFK